MVLSAFDIALNLEPYEHFDLSLGFSLGILDNDRSRQKYPQEMHLEDFLHGNKRSRKEKSRGGHALSGKPDEVPAAMFEDQSIPTINLAASMRSSVPTLKAENDWTFHFFLLFMIATALVVYVAYQESIKKREKTRPRGRAQKKPLLQDGLLPFLLHYYSNSEEPVENVTVGLVVVKVSSFVAEAVVNYFKDVGKTIYLGIAGDEQSLPVASQKIGASKSKLPSKDARSTGKPLPNGADQRSNETLWSKLLGFLKMMLGSKREINLTKISSAPPIISTQKLEVFSVGEERAKPSSTTTTTKGKDHHQQSVQFPPAEAVYPVPRVVSTASAPIKVEDISNSEVMEATTSESDHEQMEDIVDSVAVEIEETRIKESEEKSKVDDLPRRVSSNRNEELSLQKESSDKRSKSPNHTSLKQLVSNSNESTTSEGASEWQEATKRRVQFKANLVATTATNNSGKPAEGAKETKKSEQRKAASPSKDLVGVLKNSPSKLQQQNNPNKVSDNKKPHHTVSLEEFTQKKSNTTTITDNATLIKNEPSRNVSPTKLTSFSPSKGVDSESTGSKSAGASKPPSYKQAVVTSAKSTPTQVAVVSTGSDEDFGSTSSQMVTELFASPTKATTQLSAKSSETKFEAVTVHQQSSFASIMDQNNTPAVLHTRDAAFKASAESNSSLDLMHGLPPLSSMHEQSKTATSTNVFNNSSIATTGHAPPPGLQLLGAGLGVGGSHSSALPDLNRLASQSSNTFVQNPFQNNVSVNQGFTGHSFGALSSSPQATSTLSSFGNDSLFGASYSTPNAMSLLPSSLFTSPLASYKPEVDDDALFLNGVLDDILYPSSSPTPTAAGLYKHNQHQEDDILFGKAIQHHANMSSFEGLANNQRGINNGIASTPPASSLLQQSTDGLISDLSPHAPVFLPSNLSMAAPRMDNSSVLSDPMQYLSDNPAFYFNPDDLWEGGNKYEDNTDAL